MAEPPPVPPVEAPSRMEMALSWLIFPGTGQWIQRRRLAACLFAGPTLVACTVLMVEVIHPMVKNIIALFRIMDNQGDWEVAAPSVTIILITFGIVILMYILSGIDATLAYRRRMTAWNLRKLSEKMGG